MGNNRKSLVLLVINLLILTTIIASTIDLCNPNDLPVWEASEKVERIVLWTTVILSMLFSMAWPDINNISEKTRSFWKVTCGVTQASYLLMVLRRHSLLDTMYIYLLIDYVILVMSFIVFIGFQIYFVTKKML